MKSKVIDYVIRVIGATEKGHPIQRITNSFHDASIIYDGFCKSHPEFEIVIYETTEKEIVRFSPAKKEQPPQPILKCPKGHSGLTDGKPNIVKSNNDNCYCKICGDFFTVLVQ